MSCDVMSKIKDLNQIFYYIFRYVLYSTCYWFSRWTWPDPFVFFVNIISSSPEFKSGSSRLKKRENSCNRLAKKPPKRQKTPKIPGFFGWKKSNCQPLLDFETKLIVNLWLRTFSWLQSSPFFLLKFCNSPHPSDQILWDMLFFFLYLEISIGLN